MPLGLVLWKWDERIGAEILSKYPQDISIEVKTLLQLYSQHLYSSKADVISLYVGAVNIVSVWTGSVSNYFLSLVLSVEEESENFEELISDTMYYLLPYIESNTYENFIPSLFNRFIEYPNAVDEQKHAMLYTNDVIRTIMNILQEEAIYFRDELLIWIEEKLKTKAFNYTMVLERLSRLGFIKMATLPEIEGTFLFLLHQLVVFRAPPADLHQKFAQYQDPDLEKEITKGCRDYFQYYKPSERDSIDIANILSNQNYFKIIDYLRKAGIATKETLKKLRLHGIQDASNLVKELENKDIIYTAINKAKQEVYALKSDIIIDASRPTYILANLVRSNLEKRKNKILIKEHLRILKENFYELGEKVAASSDAEKQVKSEA